MATSESGGSTRENDPYVSASIVGNATMEIRIIYSSALAAARQVELSEILGRALAKKEKKKNKCKFRAGDLN